MCGHQTQTLVCMVMEECVHARGPQGQWLRKMLHNRLGLSIGAKVDCSALVAGASSQFMVIAMVWTGEKV